MAEEVGGTWRDELKLLHCDGLWVGISALRRGGWSLRLVAPDSVKLRQALRDVRRILSGAYPRLAADLRKL
jgi:urease accessory protein